MIWLVYLHVISVVIWIGGVSFVTLIVFPALGRMEDSMAKVSFFMGFEKMFQLLAKILIIIVGSTGILLFLERGGFVALTQEETFLLSYKFFIWLFYFILLFGAEKRLMAFLFLQRQPLRRHLKYYQYFIGL